LAAILLWLVQMDFLGFRPWYLVWKYIPGAIGVRTTFRSQIATNFVSCLVVVRALEVLYSQSAVKRGALLATVLSTLLIGEQFNRRSPPRFWRSEQLAWLAELPPPPAQCQSFVLAAQQPGPKEWWEYQSDAMIVAALTRLPTVNGNSSWWPEGWNLDDPAKPGYLEAVRQWVEAKRIGDGLCILDLQKRVWSEYF
jgi:hypothetical protein